MCQVRYHMVSHWSFPTTPRTRDVCCWLRVERAWVGTPVPSGSKARAFSIMCVSGGWKQVSTGANSLLAYAVLGWFIKWIIFLPLVRTLKTVRRLRWWEREVEYSRGASGGAGCSTGWWMVTGKRWGRAAGHTDSALWRGQGSATKRQTGRVAGTARWQGGGDAPLDPCGTQMLSP